MTWGPTADVSTAADYEQGVGGRARGHFQMSYQNWHQGLDDNRPLKWEIEGFLAKW